MNTTTPSCSALAQNGWNFGSLISSPLTLPPMAAPRRLYFFTPSSSCSAARSGCCSATVAKATKRSGCAAHVSASLALLTAHTCLARSRSALYQFGLMLSASTSMPCSSIACRRTAICAAVSRSGRSCGPPNLSPISASDSATAQCACMSTVFTRLPFTTTSRRRPWARVGAAANRSQPTKKRPARVAVVWRKSRRVVIGAPPAPEVRALYNPRGRSTRHERPSAAGAVAHRPERGGGPALPRRPPHQPQGPDHGSQGPDRGRVREVHPEARLLPPAPRAAPAAAHDGHADGRAGAG